MRVWSARKVWERYSDIATAAAVGVTAVVVVLGGLALARYFEVPLVAGLVGFVRAWAQ